MAPSAILFDEVIDNKQPLTPQIKTINKQYNFNNNAVDEACSLSSVPKELIGLALNKRIDGIDTDSCAAGEEDAFFVADLGHVYRQHLRWKKMLPRIQPHYAVKCNPDPYVLQLLAALGNGFDCASKTEIEQVLSFGVNPSRIIYAHPCKTKSYLRSAAEQGVCQMTFDNAAELYKIRDFHPKAKLLLRITTDDSASLCRLSQKFGAPPEMVVPLLTLAKQLELDIVGVAFHVGSGASDPQAFVNAVRDAHSVFEQASEIGYNLQILDVGGGFMSDTFEEMAMALSSAVEEYFPPHIRVIAEPGRFYVASAFTIAVNVIARRAIKDDAMNKTSCMLYINDGVYGNFSSIMFDHQQPVPKVLKAGGNHYFNQYQPETLKKSSESFGKMLTEYSIWGPTCDGIDCITTSWSCATLLDVGDWLFFEHMGAYTKCSATRFNGFPDSHDTIYVSSEAAVHAMLNL